MSPVCRVIAGDSRVAAAASPQIPLVGLLPLLLDRDDEDALLLWTFATVIGSR